MHHTWSHNNERASCGVLLSEAQMKATAFDPRVSCVNCKSYLRTYFAAFPRAHSEKLEGGAR